MIKTRELKSARASRDYWEPHRRELLRIAKIVGCRGSFALSEITARVEALKEGKDV